MSASRSGDQRLGVFISATSSDLAAARQIVHEELLKSGLYPQIQEYIRPDPTELASLLRQKIVDCDAVIVLAGFAYGAEPSSDSGRRSYTQIEYDIAQELGKPLFVFMTTEEFMPPDSVEQSAEQLALQIRHREALLDAGHRAEPFSSESELRLLANRTVPAIRDLAWRLELLYLHPPSPPAQFVGRVEELRQLQEYSTRKTPAVIAVLGMGGQGKTTLVQHWLLNTPKRPFAAGFWCTAYRGGFTFDMFLDAVLDYLTEGAFDKTSCPAVPDRVRVLLDLLQQHPVLLVLDGVERWLRGWGAQPDRDDADTLSDREGLSEEFDGFLAEVSGLTNGSHLILMSRALPAVLDGRDYALVPVRDEAGPEAPLAGLDPRAAVELLERLGVKGERDELDEAAAHHGYHPLALTVLAGLLSKRYGGRINRLPRVHALDPRRALYQLLDESVRELPGDAQTRQFLEVAALTLGTAPLRAIAAGMGVLVCPDSAELEVFVDRAVSLAEWHLISWFGYEERVEVHPLVRSYFESKIEPDRAREIHQRLSVFYADEPVPHNPTSLQDVSSRYLAIRHAILAGDIDSAAAILLGPMTQHQTFIEWMSAWSHFSTGISLLEDLSGATDGALRGDFLLARAAMYHRLGNPGVASEGIGQAIAIFEHLEDHESLAKALNARGVIQRERGASSKAIEDFNRSLAALNQLPSDTHDVERSRALVTVNISDAYWDVGCWSAALDGYNTAVAALERLHDRRDSVAFALAIANRGATLSDMGDWPGARADLQRAMLELQRIPGGGQPEIALQLAQVRTIWGAAALEHSEIEEALKVFSEAATSLDRLVSEGRKESELALSIALKAKGVALGLLGRHAEALPNLNRAVDISDDLVREGMCPSATLGYHLLDRAKVRHQLGDVAGSNDDRARGYSIVREFRDRWDRESDAGSVFLRKSVEAIEYLAPENPQEVRELLTDVLTYTRKTIEETGCSEALQAETKRALQKLSAMRELLSMAEADDPAILDLLAQVLA